MTGLCVWRCEGCDRHSFPRRELCPYCGGRVLEAERVDSGIAIQVTSHRGVAIACVQVGDDVTLLARAHDGVASGSEVTLSEDGGAPVAALA